MALIDGERIIRFFKGQYKEIDESYVNEVFCDKSKEEELKHLLFKQFCEFLSESNDNKTNLNHLLYKLNFDITTDILEKKERKSARFLNWSLRVAGILIILLSISFGLKGYLINKSHKETYIEIKAPTWSRVQFKLPDGTNGWLNSNSYLKYKGDFKSNRKVVLDGEAYFNVFTNKKKPFTVQMNNVFVKAFGTRFNLASYQNENNIEVVLEEGNLVFGDNNMMKIYTMNPKELLIYDKNLKKLITEKVLPQKYTLWTEGKLIFRNDPLDVIAKRLERWFNIDVKIESNTNNDIRLRATFVDESLEEILGILKRSLPINYRIENQSLTQDSIYTKKKVIIYVKSK